MDIGKEKREVVIEPVTVPVPPRRVEPPLPEPVREPEPIKEPERV